MKPDPLAPLRTKFRERTIDDAQRLRDAAAAGDRGRPDAERIVHGLAGSAGMFGFEDLGDAAGALDRRFAERNPPSREEILALAARIERALGRHS
ncbi:Hpt domain-containing protein [Brevundimonas sp. Root1279]|uniref:Hpt domain-containing protein n=1 Tax=Brevundimonas sp. Root1279 TaxID=1736443 RepID=UPI000701BB41|nr:Hpt domain-containing protein [Brevundimonas sp. Root1279]KQW82948.1 hypothetical protein ASC65_06270 [Brevundimonas sp. Root1279]